MSSVFAAVLLAIRIVATSDFHDVENNVNHEVTPIHQEVSKKTEVKALSYEDSENLGDFDVTAYDLNENCCSKKRGENGFGETKSGFSLEGLSREEAQTVAVDSDVIPLGSKLYIEFPDPYSDFSGIYYARDTGSKIKGRKLDLFMGDFGKDEPDDSVWEFGHRSAKVFLIGES